MASSPPFLLLLDFRELCGCIWRAGRGNNGNAYLLLHLAFSIEEEVSEWTMLSGFAMQVASRVWEMHP